MRFRRKESNSSDTSFNSERSYYNLDLERQNKLVIHALGNCHKLTVLLGLFVGVSWILMGQPEIAIVPFYVVLTFPIYHYILKKGHVQFAIHATAIGGISIPIFSTIQLGGIEQSGGIMLYAVSVLVTLTTFFDVRKTIIYSTVLCALVVGSYFAEDFLNNNTITELPKRYRNILFIQNLLGNIFYVFVFTVSFVRSLKKLISELSSYVKLINSEKMTALGQVSAGIAHEVNTPLGAIQSYSEEIEHIQKDIIDQLPDLVRKMSNEELDAMREILSARKNHVMLNTKHEREARKKLEQELRAQDIIEPSYIASKLVHSHILELNNSLLIILNSNNAIQIVDSLSNLLSLKSSNQNTKIAVDKASRIVSALKMYLRQEEEGSLQEVDLAENMEIVLTIYQNILKKGIQVVRQFDEIPTVVGNQERLNQVWTNLLHNAIHAMNGQGELTIAIKAEGDYAVISFSDTGGGIAPEIREKIFEAFFTTKKTGEGSGLGLDIVKKITDDHLGSIRFESELGVGTTFFVKIPFKR